MAGSDKITRGGEPEIGVPVRSFLGKMRLVDSDDQSRSIIPLPDASLAIARPEAGRKLAEMNAELRPLALWETLCKPERQQILLWAEDLELEPREMIRRLLDSSTLWRNDAGSAHSPLFRDSHGDKTATPVHRGGPNKGLRRLVVTGEEGFDGRFQVRNAGQDTAADRFVAEFPKPAFDQIGP